MGIEDEDGEPIIDIIHALNPPPDKPLLGQKSDASYKPRQFSKGSIGTSDERICAEVRSLNLNLDKPLLAEDGEII